MEKINEKTVERSILTKSSDQIGEKKEQSEIEDRGVKGEFGCHVL